MNTDQRIFLRAELDEKFSLEIILAALIKECEGSIRVLYDEGPRFLFQRIKLETELSAYQEIVSDLRHYTGERPTVIIDDNLESLQEGLMTDAGLTKDEREKMSIQIDALERLKTKMLTIQAVFDAITTEKLPHKKVAS